MRNLTVRFERTKLVEIEDTDECAYDVSDNGELIRARETGFNKHGDGEDECFIALSEESADISGKCVSTIENAAAFACGAVVSLDWTAGAHEGAEVVGNVVSVSLQFSRPR